MNLIDRRLPTNDENEALAYVETITAYLERDMRTAQQTPTGIPSQLH